MVALESFSGDLSQHQLSFAEGELIVEERAIRLRRADITVARFGVLWVPSTRRL